MVCIYLLLKELECGKYGSPASDSFGLVQSVHYVEIQYVI